MSNSIMTDGATENPSEHQMLMEVFTAFHRITGMINTTLYRTNGVLNSELPYIVLENVSTSSLIRPFDPPIESRQARINKDSIVISVPNEELDNDRLARRSRPAGSFLQRRILLGLGNFEISGNLHMEQELEVDSLLFSRAENFIGLTDASIFYLPNSSLKFPASTLLINKLHANFICSGAP